jgi:hypothetical protein
LGETHGVKAGSVSSLHSITAPGVVDVNVNVAVVTFTGAEGPLMMLMSTARWHTPALQT